MPIQSKYSNAEVEALIQSVMELLAQRKAPLDLQLMVLGDSVANLLLSRCEPAQAKQLAAHFGEVLNRTVQSQAKSQH